MIVILMLFVFLEKLCMVAFAKAGEIDEYRGMKTREDVQDDLTGHLRWFCYDKTRFRVGRV